jgi:hypothetical protein
MRFDSSLTTLPNVSSVSQTLSGGISLS